MKEPEYDERTCITAGELRAMKVAVPEDIPNIGWVPRAAMRFAPGKAEMGDKGQFVISMSVTFTEPFRWIQLTCTIDPPD